MIRNLPKEIPAFLISILGITVISAYTGVRPRDLYLSLIIYLLIRLNLRTNLEK